MSDSDGMGGGIFARVRLLIDKVLHLVETRLDLLSVELHEEKCRLIESLIWASAAVFLGGMALFTITITIIFVLWANYETRMWALGILSFFYLAAAIFCLFKLKRRFHNGHMPFEESLREIKKDRECLDIHN